MVKKLSFILAFSIGCAVFFAVFFVTQHSRALEISNDCQGADRQDCLLKKILDETSAHPESSGKLLNDFSKLLKSHNLQDDPRIFSPIVHYVGMNLFGKRFNPATAFRYCGENFKQGCLHGYIMEYLENLPRMEHPSDMLKVCDFSQGNNSQYANCIHGVGHEFLAMSREPLVSLLERCKKAPRSVLSACVSGVFMEFSTGSHLGFDDSAGGHSHLPTGSIELPCSTVPVEFVSTCYSSAGAYRQYLPGKETFAQSADFCANVPERYRDSCMLGLAEKIYTATAEDMYASKKICATFRPDLVSICEKSIQDIKALESVL